MSTLVAKINRSGGALSKRLHLPGFPTLGGMLCHPVPIKRESLSVAGSLHSWASCVTDKAAAFFSGFRPTTGFGGCFDEQTLKKRRNHRSEIERDVVNGDREFRQSLTECSVDSGSVAAVR